jgi:CheY-like chemotaxis protein
LHSFHQSEEHQLHLVNPAVISQEIANILPLPGAWVLLVEDQSDIAELFQLVIEATGAKVLTVSLVSEAVRLLDYFVFDALVSDIQILREDGDTLIHQVKKLEVKTGKQIPVIAITARQPIDRQQTALTESDRVSLARLSGASY